MRKESLRAAHYAHIRRNVQLHCHKDTVCKVYMYKESRQVGSILHPLRSVWLSLYT